MNWRDWLFGGLFIDRALAYIIGFICIIVMFVLASEVYHTLSFIAIFSSIEMMTTVKKKLTGWTQAMSLYYELKVVFERFASVFNIENKSMI